MIKRVIVGSAIAAASWAAYYNVRRWWETWGVDPTEADRALPGDDLVAGALSEDTRGITIDAPPEAVWPWLVQMGYNRAGWYSYDRMDMSGGSADRIVPEWQQLEVGDSLPTHPDGGFEVRVLDPGHALVVYVDSAIAEQWTKKDPEQASSETTPPGLAASGRFLDTTMPREFAGSWAFVVEPAGEGRTRLVERFRYRASGGGAGGRAMGAMLGFGVFVMAQRHMTGLRERVEQAARAGATGDTQATAAATATAPAGNGHAAPEPLTEAIATAD